MMASTTRPPAFLLLLAFLLPSSCRAARFSMTGPVLTLTLKDEAMADAEPKKWVDVGSLRPNALWSVATKGPPLPNWLPALKSCRATLGYRYQDLKRQPSFLEGDVRFSSDLVGDIQIQPTYELKLKKTSFVIQATRGASYVVARLTTKGKKVLEHFRGSFVLNLPFAAVGAVRVTPSFDFIKSYPTCTMEGVTGSGRTKAILNLEVSDPTLTVLHALDERNTIAPEISLHTAKILYQWTLALQSGSLQTKVDPISAIYVTWTDRAMNGKWVTDFTLPLKGTTISDLAANVRVRRQFTF